MRPMAKPIKCEHCGRENDPSLSSCLDCGRSLARPPPPPTSTCARCGAPVLAGYRFCGRCGAEVGHTPAAEAGAAAKAAAAPVRGLRLSTVRTDGSPGTVYPLRPPQSLCG